MPQASVRMKRNVLIFSLISGLLIFCVWFFSLKPSNTRPWAVEFSRLSKIETSGNQITIENFRDFKWQNARAFEPIFTKGVFDLSKLDRLDLIVEPFKDSDYLAHTMLRFGFSDHKSLIVSVEARREEHETYSLPAGFFRQFELIYVFGSEEDLLGLRAIARKARLYQYPIKADKQFMTELLKDLARSANSLHQVPKFYRSILDNCTTTLVKHFDRVGPKKIGLRKETILPAMTGKLLYQLGYMDTDLSYEKAQEHFRIDQSIR